MGAGLTGTGAAGFSPATGNFQGITKFGWTAGAGVEVAFTPNWSAKVEYLFIDLPQGKVCNLQASCGVDAISFTVLLRQVTLLNLPPMWCASG